MSKLERAWQIDQVCCNAWPAIRQVSAGDWSIRLSSGLTRRANSVNPLIPGARDLGSVLGLAQQLYGAAGQIAFVRVPSVLDPTVDRYLEQQGYSAEAETLSLYGALEASTQLPEADLRLTDRADDDWLRSKARMNGFDQKDLTTYRQILSGIALPSAYAALTKEGRTKALAYAALQDRLLTIESVVTEAEARNRGFARRVLQTLFHWGRESGAEAVCLQVEADNDPAVALYRKLGLTQEVYRYHYRRAPSSANSTIVP